MLSTWGFVIALTLFGFALLTLELLVIPGFGLTGIVGILAILGAVYYANARIGLWQASLVFLVALAASVFFVSRATRSGSLTRLKNPAKSPGRVGEEPAGVSKRPPLGAKGVAVTPLRPAGIVQVAEQRYDVVADGPIVELGQAVEIVGFEGNIIRVRAL